MDFGKSCGSTRNANGLASLADFTAEPLIKPRLSSENPADIICELIQLLHQEGAILNDRAFRDAVMNRESLISTAMNDGIAFPHARLGGLKQLNFALGRSVRPINWGAGASPVDLVFLIAIPESDATAYLNLISGLARLGRETTLLKKLHTAPDAVQLFSVLKEVKVRHA
jgi:mannitol/fructose-specific phosphotransferase system IIA component (Ntr-type)